jgi:hypothetical protein
MYTGHGHKDNHHTKRQPIRKQCHRVEDTVRLCSPLLAQQNLDTFLGEVPLVIKRLILSDTTRHRRHSIALRIGMAACHQGHYREIYSENKTTPFPYKQLVAEVRNSHRHPLVVNRQSLTMVLHSNAIPLGVLHMEGIVLSPQLQKRIGCAYSFIFAALNSFQTKQTVEEMQQNIFIHLANMVEQKSALCQ